MAMNAKTIAIHESGHAVMQWLVGWHAELEFIQMRRIDGGVADGFMKVPAPDRRTYTNPEVARKKLLVLLAGAATTSDPTSQHNKRDFEEACFVLNFLFRCPIKWKPELGLGVEQEEPNAFLQKANSMCRDVVRDPLIRNGIEAVAEKLLLAVEDENGICRVTGYEVAEVCRDECSGSVWLSKLPEWTSGNIE